MIDRCYNPNIRNYKHYGARGITVCDKWIKSFRNFYDDMADGYSDDLTIDRIDVNGNYELSNCKWSTTQEQMRNRTTSLNYTLDGKTDTLKNICDLHGLCYQSVWVRLQKGISIEDAVTQPMQPDLIYTVDGVTDTLKRLCVLNGVKYNTVYNRIAKGMNVEEAIKRPIQPGIKFNFKTPA